MRFVPSLPPVPSPAEEEAPRPLRAIRPARRVETPMRVTMVPYFRRKARAEEKSASEPEVQERRSVADRRKWCRRLTHGHPLLDTRSREERRKRSGRSSDIAATLDEKI